MSRDMRPVDLYLCDKMLKKDKNVSLRDIMYVHILDDGTKQEKPVQDPLAKKAYPELSFLFPDFRHIYSSYSTNSYADTVFKEFENALAKCEANVSGRIYPNPVQKFYDKTNEEFYDAPISDVVREWFYGNLDRDFYYSDENDYQFEVYMRHQIENTIMKTRKVE